MTAQRFHTGPEMEHSFEPRDGELPARGLELKYAGPSAGQIISDSRSPPHNGTGITLPFAFLLRWILGTKFRV